MTRLAPLSPAGPESDRSAGDSPADSRPAASRWHARWVVPSALALGYVLNVLFRLSLVTKQDFPTVSPDESMYLVMARILAGRPTTEIAGDQVIPAGYSLLISPALRLTEDPVLGYHLILGINALISCLVLPMAYWGLRRLNVSQRVSYIAAALVTLIPPVVFYTQFAMADTPLPVLVLAWLIGLHGLFSEGTKKRRIRFALLAAFAAGYCLLSHDRGGVIIALTGLVLLVALVLKWAPRIATASALALLAVMFVLKQFMTTWMISQIDGAAPSQVGNAVFETLENTRLLRRTIMRMIGHLWYFMTSTWGLGALALVVCVCAVLSSRFTLANRVVAFLMVALLGGIALAAAAGLPGDNRLDTIVYARYLSLLVPVYLLVAVATLYHVRGRKKIVALGVASIGVTSALTAALLHMASQQWSVSYFALWGLPDAIFLSSLAGQDWESFHAAHTTAVALAVFAVLMLLRLLGGDRRAALATGVVGVALAVFGVCATVSVTDHVTKVYATERVNDGTGFIEKAGIRPGDRLVMDDDVRWEIRTTTSYLVLDGRVWTRFLNKDDSPPADANVAVLALKDKKAGATESWRNAPAGWRVDRDVREHEYVIWRRG
ncbi:phospholipid carrier-dependent glycosyltransferase [Streptomyces virginiae]|uniref:phospholipid carrier-dependent glycosyltransferase n=1 Tax=Streptomyces virginiae TaxID=1961 RepID=UPI0022546697|nr:phospholipid carrier-dependent glycosyltransferase [Streptomyces virginiae]MCX4958714.1 phospholipid carrier-dependent glycosyltransferase [Streptomyces virginiae]